MDNKGIKCAKCEKTIYAADKQEKYEGKIYHSGCFQCSNVDCGIKLTQQNTKGFNRMPYCQSHVPNESSAQRKSYSDHIYVNVPIVRSNETDKRTSLSDDYEEIMPQSSNDEALYPTDLRNEIRTILKQASSNMVEEVFTGLSRDMHIIVCGSPRVGKSTLINVICGKELAKAKEGLASVTHTIECYPLTGQYNTESDTIHYKYNFWDTPGFESWEKSDLKPKVKEIIDTPESKPLCMIFCASPGTFVDLTQLEWLLNLCINKRHIFCALVCTNMYAGQTKSRQAVLDSFNQLLSKFTNDSPRKQNDITFYGNIGLCAAINSQPYEDDDRIRPTCGVNELIVGIMESLVDEEVLNWCFVVLENEGFWKDSRHKLSRATKALKKLIGKPNNKEKKKDTAVFYSKK